MMRRDTGRCPNQGDLSAFYVGHLPAVQLEAIAVHLQECAGCTSVLDGLDDSTDVIVSELRQPIRLDPYPDPESRHAVELVEKIGAKDGTSLLDEAHGLQAKAHGRQSVGLAAAGQLGQYELLEKLGEGGMGQVYRARHRLMERVVALKVIHQKNLAEPAAVQRFHREIRALAQLDHPNIVRAHDADQVGDTHFLVMEYVEGITLAQLVRERGPLALREACSYIQQAAAGLHHAHVHGMVHRDLKPSNLMLVSGGVETGQETHGAQPVGLGTTHHSPLTTHHSPLTTHVVKLLDLGLARLRQDGPLPDEITATGQVMGTFDYMAPEQWEDAHAVDIRADLYSLGCTLFYLLAGRAPFSGPEHSSIPKKMKAHCEAPIPPIQPLRPDVPDELAAVLGKLLAKDPAQRYATPAEVIAALQLFTTGRQPVVLGTAPGSTNDPFVAPTVTDYSGRSPDDVPACKPAAAAWERGRRKRPTLNRVRLILSLSALGVCFIGVILVSTLGSNATTTFSTIASPQSGPIEAKGVPPGPLRIEALRILHYRGNPPELLGELGGGSFAAAFDDDVRIVAEFSAPVYCYLLAFNPNGEAQLCFPKADAEGRTAPITKLIYPAGASSYFALNDEPAGGLQVFVVLASHRQLPPYGEWRSRLGALPWEKQLAAGEVWQYDGEQFTPRFLRLRGKERERGGAPRQFQELCERLKEQPGIDVIRAVAFPVGKKR